MTRRFSLLLGATAVIALLGAGCAKNTNVSDVVNTNTTTNDAANANTNTNANTSLAASVTVLSSSYSPKTMTVRKGRPVIWTSAGGSHTVTGDNGGPNGDVSPGNPYSFTFDTVGTFPYHCVPHGFTGTVIVTE